MTVVFSSRLLSRSGSDTNGRLFIKLLLNGPERAGRWKYLYLKFV